jgi:hypothetical protein
MSDSRKASLIYPVRLRCLLTLLSQVMELDRYDLKNRLQDEVQLD